MKSLWIKESKRYDGSQLKCQFAYFNHGLLGDSVVAWRAPCHVTLEHMADGEDLLAGAKIEGDDMLHFIVEVFEQSLTTGVLLQRLLTSIVGQVISEMAPTVRLRRDGDDLYWDKKKFSISVAAKSPLGVVIHFALNVTNEGTPVETCALTDWGLEDKVASLAERVMGALVKEWFGIREATQKVKPLP